MRVRWTRVRASSTLARGTRHGLTLGKDAIKIACMKRYGPYKNGEGYLFYIDKHGDGTKRSVWVHREKMESKLGRSLEPDEVVHHINGNVSDNRLSNLAVMLLSKHSSEHSKNPASKLVLVCAECGMKFTRGAHKERWRVAKRKAGPFCGKRCVGRWSRRKQLTRE